MLNCNSWELKSYFPTLDASMQIGFLTPSTLISVEHSIARKFGLGVGVRVGVSVRVRGTDRGRIAMSILIDRDFGCRSFWNF